MLGHQNSVTQDHLDLIFQKSQCEVGADGPGSYSTESQLTGDTRKRTGPVVQRMYPAACALFRLQTSHSIMILIRYETNCSLVGAA
jgi:hypothetical protein